MRGFFRFVLGVFLLVVVIFMIGAVYFSKGGSIIPGQILALNKTPAGIYVTGEGKVLIEPDIAKVTLGSSEMAADVTNSFKAANGVITKVKSALESLGIEKKDIQTSRYTIYPEYSYEANEPIIRGYRTEHILNITVRDITKINDVITASVDVGANRIENINFTVEDLSAAYDKARGLALDDAKKKAQALALSFRANVGQVISVEEIIDETFPSSKIMPEGGGMGAGGPDISAGQLEIRLRVNVNYGLKY